MTMLPYFLNHVSISIVAAADRSQTSSLLDAREACTNAVVDALSAYAMTQNSSPQLALIAPPNLCMLPSYTHALLRSPGFRSDLKVRLDDRVHFMNQMKTLPLTYLIQSIYPDLFPIHNVANAVSPTPATVSASFDGDI
jgi:protein transport protein SEC24